MNNDRERNNPMRRCLRCLLLLTGVLALLSPYTNKAHALFGGDIVYDPTNYSKNLITATQMIQQVKQMILQVKNSDQEVEMMLLNLLTATGQPSYPLETW